MRSLAPLAPLFVLAIAASCRPHDGSGAATSSLASALSDAPVPSAPLENGEINEEDVSLAVETTAGAVSYVFQLFSDASLTVLVHEGTAVAATAGTTSVVLDDVLTSDGVDGDDPANPEDVDLVDDEEYEWRTCAFDGASCSPWSAPQRFRYDPTNDLPFGATPDSPPFFGHVGSLSPLLVAGNPPPDDDPPGTVTFKIFDDNPYEGGTLLHTSPPIQIAPSGSTSWAVDPPLQDDTFYWWRAEVTDPRGAVNTGPSSLFRVNLSNDEPESPVIVGPLDGAVITESQPVLSATGASDGDGDLLTYVFDLDVTAAFNTDALQSGQGYLCGIDGADACFTPPIALVENTRYWWRARASDGSSIGEGTLATFLLDAANDAPPAPVALSPDDVLTLSTTPSLLALASADPEGAPLTYEFEVSDAHGAVLQSASGIAPETATAVRVSWTVEAPLASGETFGWHVRAVDADGLAGPWSEPATFEVYESGGGGGSSGGCSVGGDPGRSASLSAFVGLSVGILFRHRRRRCGGF